MSQCAFGAFLWIAGARYTAEGLNLGQVTAMILYMRKISDAVSEVLNSLNAIAKVKGASYKVAEMITSEPKVVIAKDGKQDTGPEGTIDINNCVFSYPTKRDVQVLNDVTVNIKKNTVVAFVGASGKLLKPNLKFRLRKVVGDEADSEVLRPRGG